MVWECGIGECGACFDEVEAAIAHQATEHERRECKVCGTVVPDGYLAIYHAFSEHSRAEYVRAYGADSNAVRRRESIVEDVTAVVDQDELARLLDR
ncbi:DUF7565 family protein [Halovivax gelatinilyticus]|uniref:DUF7565 family protein n=1 Tax=Halovivax gelatinilyticus TaxID=2961597 RepID=UPI0020CA5E75|nr:hypothetical protein [Halovivax gelatinilyticus]